MTLSWVTLIIVMHVTGKTVVVLHTNHKIFYNMFFLFNADQEPATKYRQTYIYILTLF